jgi:hypothetical protein
MVKIMSENQSHPRVSELKIGFIKTLFTSFISVAEDLHPLILDD